MKMRLRARVFLGWFGFFVCTASFADPIDFQKWFSLQQQRSLKALFQNISPEGTAPGSVIASPSRRNPDYYFHWIRDSALTMSVVADFAQKTRFLDSRMKSLQVLNEYAAFSRRNQLTPNRSGSGNPEDLLGLGEPKFQVDGKSFDGDWARPQSDGPALRALALMKFARILIQQGKESYVREYLYDGQLPSNTVIKTDLDYVSRFWRAKTFDLWEETPGDHFYTRMVQRKALLEGTRFAEDMKDLESAKWYRGQTQSLTAEIKKHWNPTNGKIYPTLNRVGGLYDKPSALDSAVILGVLHGDTGDGYFGPTDERVLSTAYQLKDTFRRLYVINQNDEIPGLGIGRYPEDTYDGSDGRGEGNPWFLITLAFAELHYKAAADFRNQGQIKITNYNKAFFEDLLPTEQLELNVIYGSDDEVFSRLITALKTTGDSYLLRVAYHSNRQTGSMSEQFNRQTGIMQSAVDLTWNYAAFLTASWARPTSAEYVEQLRNMGLMR